jgi:hypothetical protein
MVAAVKSDPNIRRTGVVKSKTVSPPWAPTVMFTIKKANMIEDIERQNLYSRVRYIQDVETTNEMITEREAPQGDIQFETVMLVLIGWSLKDDDGNNLEVTRENALKYMEPRERVWLYQQAMQYNPLWMGRLDEGKDESASDSNPKSSVSSTEEASTS